MMDVSVCICSYRRPAGLLRLLRSLRALDPSGPSFEVIVVDNDREATGRPAVLQAREEGLPVQYLVEPVRGIARARNSSLRPAVGEYVAFIDDDEEADPGWLVHLWGEVARNGVTGGIGPVLPRFPEGTPRWMVEGGFFERIRRPAGTALYAKETRMGNTLVRRQPLMALEGPFDERYNFTGGEDGDLFTRMIAAGARVIAVDSAIVYEHLTPARTSLSWLLLRRFREGLGSARLDAVGAPGRPPRWRSLAPLASGLAWGVWGLFLFPASRVRGVYRLSHAARRLGRVAFLNGWSVRPYLNDSWR